MLPCPFGAFGEPVSFRENCTGAKTVQGTLLRVMHDGAALHVRFECEDSHPWATITQRDGPLWEEEVVEVFIDPVGDGECYFEFEVNPLGTLLDLVLRRSRSGYNKDFAWDCEGFAATVERTASGWNAELRIPFASLVDAIPRPGSEWRINFTRIDRPPAGDRELSAWSPTLLGTFHAVTRFGTIRFE